MPNEKTPERDLLLNAIVSIRLGLEDYELAKDNPDRILSAIRNLYSGILLLLKEKLRMESPPGSNDVFIREKIIPKKVDGKVRYYGHPKNKTVSYGPLVERIKNFVSDFDDSDLNSLNKIRNNIEHHSPDRGIAELTEAMAKVFNILVSFPEKHLDYPAQELVGWDNWGKMVKIKEVHDLTRLKCIESFERANIHKSTAFYKALKGLRCPSCWSELVAVNNAVVDDLDKPLLMICLDADCETEYSLSVEEIMASAYEYAFDFDDGHVAIDCSSCGGALTVHVDEMRCVLCGEKSVSSYSHCEECSQQVGWLNEGCEGCQYASDSMGTGR
jgi:hypothetical protein